MGKAHHQAFKDIFSINLLSGMGGKNEQQDN